MESNQPSAISSQPTASSHERARPVAPTPEEVLTECEHVLAEVNTLLLVSSGCPAQEELRRRIQQTRMRAQLALGTQARIL